MTVVAMQVVIANGSDQPLDFSVADIHLKDETGTEFEAGRVIGSEPRLVSQNLPDGERTRGWIWFAVPEGTLPTQVIFTGPPPQFRVTLPG
jgi:hypothetical protein